MPLDNRNRCTQFMTDVTQETHLHLIIFLDFIHHTVKVNRQITNFIVTFNLRTKFQITWRIGDNSHRFVQLSHRTKNRCQDNYSRCDN